MAQTTWNERINFIFSALNFHFFHKTPTLHILEIASFPLTWKYSTDISLCNEFSPCRRARIGLIYTWRTQDLNSKWSSFEIRWTLTFAYWCVWSISCGKGCFLVLFVCFVFWQRIWLASRVSRSSPCRYGKLWSERRRRCSRSARCPKLFRSGSSSRTKWKFNTTTSRSRAPKISCASPKTR